MSAISSIEWTDRTWNPVRGCSVVSPGCVNCYAMKFAHRFSGPGKPYEGLTKQTKAGPQWTGAVRYVTEEVAAPQRWRKPSRIFVNSMSDLFHDGVTDAQLVEIFAVMANSPEHTFQVLTKRPARMRYFLGRLRWAVGLAVLSVYGYNTMWARLPYLDSIADYWPPLSSDPARQKAPADDPGFVAPNVWLGVSVEDQTTADARIPLLLDTPAAVRFVSYEPALGPVDFAGRGYLEDFMFRPSPLPGLDWIIVGGESGPGARPFNIAWARSTVRQCRAAGVQVFVKQLGALPYEYLNATPDWSGDLRSYRSGLAALDALSASQGGRMVNTIANLTVRDLKGGDPAEWPEDLRVREFPQ